jgi:hypothetical protein
MQTVRSGPFASWFGQDLRRDPVRLASAFSGRTHPVRWHQKNSHHERIWRLPARSRRTEALSRRPLRCFPRRDMFLSAPPLYKGEASGGIPPSKQRPPMPGLPLSTSVVGRRDEGEEGEQPASNGSARGRWCQQRSSPSTCAGTYRNQTTGEPFSWAVATDVMLPGVLRMHACQERRMELFEAVRANPDRWLSSTKCCKN